MTIEIDKKYINDHIKSLEIYCVKIRDGKEYRETITNLLHREDGPAVECDNGDKYYYNMGQLHRDKQPAIYTYINGSLEGYQYFNYGRWHREDGPAFVSGLITKPKIEKFFFQGKEYKNLEELRKDNQINGKISININTKNGKVEDGELIKYYKNDLLHREDGPAVEHKNGNALWFIDGKLHNQNGPAKIISGKESYYLYNKEYSKEDWLLIRLAGIIGEI